MWTFLLLFGLMAVLIPTVCYWAWRGKCFGKQLTGMRLELNREQVQRQIGMVLPLWGLVLLMTVEQSIELFPASQSFRQSWRVFFCASDLFLMGFMVAGFVRTIRQEREKHQHRNPFHGSDIVK